MFRPEGMLFCEYLAFEFSESFRKESKMSISMKELSKFSPITLEFQNTYPICNYLRFLINNYYDYNHSN